MSRITTAVLAAGFALWAGVAAAQPAQTPQKPGDPGPNRPAGGTLSDKLNATDGVIKPPENADPEIHKPTPDTGTTPVIPPPSGPEKPQPK